MRPAAVLVAMFMSGAALAQVVEPEEFREDHYRAPVPETLAGAIVVDSEAAHGLWQDGKAAFIDVLPRPPKPANLPEGTIWHEKPRLSIPGAIWLPNVGYGRIADVTDAYFRTGLEKATGGEKSRPVLFFCLDECWMSWNAAKRALEYGYATVYWYPEGTDGWRFQDYPVEDVKPEPFVQ